jgi:hypothetical protein
MRILFLTLLFAGPAYLLTREEAKPAGPAIDAIKLKMGAPERVAPPERLLTVEKPVAPAAPTVEAEETNSRAPAETEAPEDDEAAGDAEEPEVQTTAEGEGWNDELKNTLTRLEPADGEEIYKSYVKAQENYQAELEALRAEKEQKTSDLAASEVDQLISQLEASHQERLKEILGSHYDAVRDQHQDYLEASEEE